MARTFLLASCLVALVGAGCGGGGSTTPADASPGAIADASMGAGADASPDALTAVCGNGVREGTEECDDGARNTDTACVPDFGGCGFCTTNCVAETRGEVLDVGVPEGYGAGFWTDRLINDGTDVHNGTAGPCLEQPNLGALSLCLHVGELRWFQAPDRTSCAGLSAQDALDAFHWRCVERQVFGVDEAWLLSTGLKDGKHLSSLIDFAAADWLANSLTIFDGADSIYTSADEKWWANTFATAAVGAGGVTLLDQPFVVNIVRKNGAQLFDLAGDHVILVVEPGVVVTHPGGTATHLSLSGADTWLEGEFDGLGVDPRPILASGTRHTIRNFTIRNYGRGARFEGKNARYEFIRGATSSGSGRGPTLDFVPLLSLIRHIYVADSAAEGIIINGLHGNIAAHLFVTGSHGDGIGVSSRGLTLMDAVSISNNGSGLVTNNREQLIMNATLTLNDGDGFEVGACTRCTIARVASTTNAGDGYLVRTNAATFHDANAQANSRLGFHLANPGNVFRGQMAWGNNQTFANDPGNTCGGTCEACECDTGTGVAGMTPFWGLLEGEDADGQANACFLDTDPANPAPRIDDQRATNYGDTVGRIELTNLLPRDEIADILDVPHRYVGWGSSGCLAQPVCDGMGACPAPGTVTCPCDPGDVGCVESPVVCQLYDLRLIESVRIRKTLHPTGNDVITHTFATNASAAFCANHYPGTVHDAASSQCVGTFLDHAVEVVGDLIGNENYRCESGETCIYTPYRASYMGEGDLIPARVCNDVGESCMPFVWQDGIITGVTLLQYEHLSARDAGGSRIETHAL